MLVNAQSMLESTSLHLLVIIVLRDLGISWDAMERLGRPREKQKMAMEVLRISFESGRSCDLPNLAEDGCGADTR